MNPPHDEFPKNVCNECQLLKRLKCLKILNSFPPEPVLLFIKVNSAFWEPSFPLLFTLSNGFGTAVCTTAVKSEA